MLFFLCRAGYFTPMLVFYFLAPPACWIARRTWHYSSTVPDNCTPAGCGSGTFAAAFHSLLCSREGPSVHCHVFNVMTAAFGHTRHFSRLDDSVLVFPWFGGWRWVAPCPVAGRGRVSGDIICRLGCPPLGPWEGNPLRVYGAIKQNTLRELSHMPLAP